MPHEGRPTRRSVVTGLIASTLGAPETRAAVERRSPTGGVKTFPAEPRFEPSPTEIREVVREIRAIQRQIFNHARFGLGPAAPSLESIKEVTFSPRALSRTEAALSRREKSGVEIIGYLLTASEYAESIREVARLTAVLSPKLFAKANLAELDICNTLVEYNPGEPLNKSVGLPNSFAYNNNGLVIQLGLRNVFRGGSFDISRSARVGFLNVLMDHLKLFSVMTGRLKDEATSHLIIFLDGLLMNPQVYYGMMKDAKGRKRRDSVADINSTFINMLQEALKKLSEGEMNEAYWEEMRKNGPVGFEYWQDKRNKKK